MFLLKQPIVDHKRWKTGKKKRNKNTRVRARDQKVDRFGNSRKKDAKGKEEKAHKFRKS